MNTISNNHLIYFAISLFVFGTAVLSLDSCKKLVEIDSPTTSISGKNVYNNDGTAAAVLTGIYTKMSSASGITGSELTSVGCITGLSADELVLYNGSTNNQLIAYYKNSLTTVNVIDPFWTGMYTKLFTVNSAIEGLAKSTSLTPSVKQYLLGESKFMRAFLYFYLVNLYGDVPLVLGTDYKVNNILPRATSTQVWKQIIEDLKDAAELSSSDYRDATLLLKSNERVRPTKWAAIALLARCYLYTKDWKNAEIQATAVINNTDLYHLDSLNEVFKANSSEAIWQLQPVNAGFNTEDAKVYIIPPTGPNDFNPFYLSNQLVNSFEPDDQRAKNWIDSLTLQGTTYYFPFKYKSATLNAPVTEYLTILRLSEQYLIRAEARANQQNTSQATDDLNYIRLRAGLNPVKSNNIQDILSSIYHERQVELFTEWGHRWLDLKRTQTVNNVMIHVTPQKGGSWNSNWQLYPIPQNDIILDGNISQNTGY